MDCDPQATMTRQGNVVIAPVSCEDEASVQGLVELRATLAKLRRLRGDEPELLTVLTR